MLKLAREVGIEPTTNRLTGDRSTAELPRNILHCKEPYYINRNSKKNNKIYIVSVKKDCLYRSRFSFKLVAVIIK